MRPCRLDAAEAGLLDEAEGVLSLREPLPLRTIAENFSEPRLDLLLRLWERGFANTQAVILKATSATERSRSIC